MAHESVLLYHDGPFEIHTNIGRGSQHLLVTLEHLAAILAHMGLISLAESIVESNIGVEFLSAQREPR